MDQLTIIGVGLIGGSVALAAKARGVARRVVGVGRDRPTLQRLRATGVIDDFTPEVAAGVREADLVVVCTPVDTIARITLAVLDAAPGRAVVTDAGSTKEAIVAAVEAGRGGESAHFVGSHPLAGSEKQGAANGRADLFVGRTVVVTPTPATNREAVATVEAFWRFLGAEVVRTDPAGHDRTLAATSHLPHAVASALAAVTPEQYLHLSAGGFRDTTRVAGGDPGLWAAIFRANRVPLLDALARFEAQVARLRTALEADDAAGVRSWLDDGKRVRDALGS